MEERLCPECGTPLRGRLDKKFCSDMCRNNFNNKINSDANNHVRNINNILRKNRRILHDLLVGEKTTVPRQKMTDKGFNFAYHTSTHVTRNNHTYLFCYEFGYFPLENNLVLIVKKNVE